MKAADIPEVTDDDGTAGAHRLRQLLGKTRAGGRRSPPTRSTSTSRSRRASARRCRSRRRATPSPTSSRARASSATRRSRSRCRPKASAGPTRRRRPRRTTASLVLFDRGDEVDGAGRRRGHPLPPRLRQAARGAGRLVRPDRHEHAGGAAAGVRGARRGHVPAGRTRSGRRPGAARKRRCADG